MLKISKYTYLADLSTLTFSRDIGRCYTSPISIPIFTDFPSYREGSRGAEFCQVMTSLLSSMITKAGSQNEQWFWASWKGDTSF